MKDAKNLPTDVIEVKTKFYKDSQEKQFKLLESDRAIFDWGCKQTYIALANMMTAAAQVGIDSYPMEGFDKNKIEKFLIDKGFLDKEHFDISCMVAFGYRKHEPKHDKTRQSLDKIIEFILFSKEKEGSLSYKAPSLSYPIVLSYIVNPIEE